MLTPTDEAALDRFWSERPSRPPALKIAQPPVGAALCTITCRACGKRDNVAVDWPGLLCCRCRGDLAATRARVEAGIADVDAQATAALEAWTAVQDALDDETAARWTRLVQDRTRAMTTAQRLRTQKYRDDVTTDEAAAHLAEAAAKLAEVQARIERTKANVASLLSPLLHEEARYTAEMQQLAALKGRLAIALQEIEVVEHDGAPF